MCPLFGIKNGAYGDCGSHHTGFFYSKTTVTIGITKPLVNFCFILDYYPTYYYYFDIFPLELNSNVYSLFGVT